MKLIWLEHKLISHFIRGYFDGDGCISINEKTNTFQVQFIGTESLLTSINGILVMNCDINLAKLGLNHKNNSNNIRTLGYGGRHNIKKIYDYLYNEAHIYMLRKKNKFEIITLK
jgi:intein-encoded DNA endonuclease-like protein